jgi:hypothetical protein
VAAAFYWHRRPEPDLGVVTSEDCPASLSRDAHPAATHAGYR